jgi:hypothetical protein
VFGEGTTKLYLVVFDIVHGQPTPIIVRMRDVADTGYVSDTGYRNTVNPFIMSISADPILGGLTLFVEAWSGDEYVQYYQWQVQQSNGSWVNIPGATTASFEYTGLAPGEYTVRCIVSNSSGGETISIPITVMVP